VAACLFTAIGITIPVLPRMVERRLGGNDASIGLLTAVYSVAAIGCRPLLAWVGRGGPRRLMISGGAIAAVGMLGHIGTTSLIVVGCARAVLAIGETLLFVGFASRIASLAPPGRDAEYASLGSVAVFTGLGAGPIVGEWFVSRDRWAAPFTVAAALAMTAAVLARAVPADVSSRSTTPTEATSTPLSSNRLRRLFHPVGLPTGGVLALLVAAYFGWSAYIALHADDLGMDSAAAIFVLFSVITLVARLAGAKVPERIGLIRSARLSGVGIGVALVVTALWAQPAGVYVGTVLMAVGISFMYPSLTALTVRAAGEKERTLALSTYTMFFEIGSGGAGLVVGPLAEATSRRTAFGFGGGIAAAAVACTVPLAAWAARRGAS
jgi:predicted MFS family arabinose efflux permease